jgi:hypothetical protein
MNSRTDPTDDTALERRARRNVALRFGWTIHALVYVLVNLGLAVLSAWQGKAWAMFPALGWGLALLIHGAVVMFVIRGDGMRERALARERERLRGTGGSR